MVQSVIQHSFHAGEWAPDLNARVDLAKYKSAAALLENYFVDYRGGASSRPGTRYCATAIDSTNPVRLIPFQASSTVGYILEFGNFYMRPFLNGAPIAFTLGTPYAAADLELVKFTQLVDRLFLCHPNYPPNVLQFIASNNWTIGPIPFGSTLSPPTGGTIGTTNAGNGNYTYTVTAVDANGQESPPMGPVNSTINLTSGQNTSITVSWTAVLGATSYNVYRTPMAVSAVVPIGSAFGFLMNVTGVSAVDSFISGSPLNGADFSIGIPVPKNPFQGAGVDHINVTGSGTYTTAPGVTLGAPPAGGVQATAQSNLGALSLAITTSTGSFAIGDILSSSAIQVAGVVIQVTAVSGTTPTAVTVLAPGAVTGTVPSNPIGFLRAGGGEIDGNVTWGVTSVSVVSAGSGYTSAPSVTFASGAATATAVLQSTTAGNPAVPGLFQQRLALAAKPHAVQTIDLSQTGSYYNFNVSNPIQADDAMTLSLVSGQLNEIKSMVSVPSGLLLLTNKANWLITSSSGAVSPIDASAHAHSYNGASDVPPIIANFDILFVQNKNSIVRDLTFNFYTQIYTGTDISVLSSHLFFGYQILEWAWAEEPFKVVWAIRDDGIALSMTYLKEQELIGWSHSVTQGLFQSVAVVTEPVGLFNTTGLADATYFVVQRVINGQTVKYIERLDNRIFQDATTCWTVDAGLRYVGAPTTSFSGAAHLAGATVTGLADGNVITPFVMPVSGAFTLPVAASKVTIGLPFTPKLQTLALDIGEPTIQGKRKAINGVTVRVKNTLGLTIGRTFGGAQVVMKDLVVGNVGSASNGVVTGLVTGDARTIIDPTWDVPGQYCITQPLPYPATILGVIPEFAVGDTK